MYASMQVIKNACNKGMHVGSHANIAQVWKYLSMQVCKYASMQACKHGSMQEWKYASVQVQECSYAGM